MYIEFICPSVIKGWPEFCNEVIALWRSIPGIKPPRVHWAKEWGFIEGIDEYIRKVGIICIFILIIIKCRQCPKLFPKSVPS